MSKFYLEMPDTIGGVDKIVKISDSDGKSAKEQGFKVFDSYEDAVAYRGEIANKEMNKEIKTEKFLQIPEMARTAGGLVLPATYETLRKGEEPGFKESTIDATLAGLNLVPGGRAARTFGSKVGLPILTNIERNLASKKLPSLIAQSPSIIAGEATLAGVSEGLTSIGQDRDFDPMNVAYGTGLGFAGAGMLSGERSRGKALKALGTVPGSELDKRLLKYGAKGIKPGVKISKISENEIEKVLKDIIGNNSKIDVSTPGIKEALKDRVENLITKNASNLQPEDLAGLKGKVSDAVDNFIGQRIKYSPRQLTKLPDLPGIEEPIASNIKRSVPVAVADVLKPSESSYLTELGRLRSFNTSLPEPDVIKKIPVISPLMGAAGGIGGGIGGGIARGGRTYLPTLMGLDETQQ